LDSLSVGKVAEVNYRNSPYWAADVPVAPADAAARPETKSESKSAAGKAAAAGERKGDEDTPVAALFHAADYQHELVVRLRRDGSCSALQHGSRATGTMWNYRMGGVITQFAADSYSLYEVRERCAYVCAEHRLSRASPALLRLILGRVSLPAFAPQGNFTRPVPPRSHEDPDAPADERLPMRVTLQLVHQDSKQYAGLLCLSSTCLPFCTSLAAC
jgi:hypothetical protein